MKAIQVKRLPATDTKPFRWKVVAEGVPHIIVGADSATPRDAAELLCARYGWGTDLIHGDLPNGDHVFVFAPKHGIARLEKHPENERWLQFEGTSRSFANFFEREDADKVLALVNGEGVPS